MTGLAPSDSCDMKRQEQIPPNNKTETRLDLDEGGVVVRVPEATLKAKHDALHVQPHGLPDQNQSVT